MAGCTRGPAPHRRLPAGQLARRKAYEFCAASTSSYLICATRVGLRVAQQAKLKFSLKFLVRSIQPLCRKDTIDSLSSFRCTQKLTSVSYTHLTLPTKLEV